MKKAFARSLLLMSVLLWLTPLAPSAAGAQEPGAGAEIQGAAGGPTAEEPADSRTLRDWYNMGGWIMHGLLLCSILTVSLILERAWVLRRGTVIPSGLVAKIHHHMQRREMSQVITLCGTSDSSIARVLRAGLLHFEQGLAGMQDAVEMAGAHEAMLLRRNLPMLAALANVATMMGLLGTVLGMIESFDLIAKTGTGDASVVAGGIFKALVTTAAGLGVGIPAIAFHSYLRRKVDVLEADLDELSFGMLEELSLERSDAEPVEASTGQLAPAEA